MIVAPYTAIVAALRVALTVAIAAVVWGWFLISNELVRDAWRRWRGKPLPTDND